MQHFIGRESVCLATCLAVPDQVAAALRSRREVSVAAPFGKAELIHEPGRIDSYKVVFTDNAYLQKKEAAKSAAASDASRCIDVTASAAGYDASLLETSRSPVEEEGCKSFFIQGRGKDQFFCEVHPGAKYRVRGALGGQYPFKLLKEGTF